MSRPALIGIALALLGVATPAAAHPVPFSYVDVRIDPAALDVTIVAHVYDVAHDLGIEPVERLLEPAVLASRAEAITTLLRNRIQLLGDRQPLGAGRGPRPRRFPSVSPSGCARASTPAGRSGVITVNASLFPYDPQHQTFLNVYEQVD